MRPSLGGKAQGSSSEPPIAIGLSENIKYKHGLTDLLKVDQRVHVRIMNQTRIPQGSWFTT